jgi:hypothetical protein
MSMAVIPPIADADERRKHRDAIGAQFGTWQKRQFSLRARVQSFRSYDELLPKWKTVCEHVQARIDCSIRFWNDPSRAVALRQTCDDAIAPLEAAVDDFSVATQAVFRAER